MIQYRLLNDVCLNHSTKLAFIRPEYNTRQIHIGILTCSHSGSLDQLIDVFADNISVYTAFLN